MSVNAFATVSSTRRAAIKATDAIIALISSTGGMRP